MRDTVKVVEGKVLPPVRKTIPALDGFNALNQVVDAAKECIQIHAVERTKRDQIQAYETTEIARIKAAEATLREYFEQTFTERRHNFDALFARLDTALTDGNAEVVTKVLDAVVSIARTSPIADIADLSKLRAALDDPDHVWEF